MRVTTPIKKKNGVPGSKREEKGIASDKEGEEKCAVEREREQNLYRWRQAGYQMGFVRKRGEQRERNG